MKWEDYKNRMPQEPIFLDKVRTNIECPRCGKELFFRNDIVLTTYPAKYQYECVCGFVGYSHAKWGEQQ